MTKRKVTEVAKFGGIDDLGSLKTDLHSSIGHEQQTYDASSVEAQSRTNLEMDKGEGEATIIRCFIFGMNPQTFMEQHPTKQMLFNSHIGGIEAALFRDGLKLFLDVTPRITFDTVKMQYSIFVAARPRKGYLLQEKPQTLGEIVHG